MPVRFGRILALALPLALAAGCATRPSAEAPSAAPAPVVSTPTPSLEAERAAPSPSMSVEQAQQLLEARGYRPGAIDGRMGPRTANALWRFQRDQRLPMTGRLDEATIDALRR